MKFTIKTYKLSRTANHFKQNKFFFICTSKITKDSIRTTQKLKKLNLKSYKLYKALTQKIFEDSIYESQRFLISGLVILVVPETILTSTTLPQLNKIASVVAVKLNSKIYSMDQLNSFPKFDYNNSSINLLKTVRISLKRFKVINSF